MPIMKTIQRCVSHNSSSNFQDDDNEDDNNSTMMMTTFANLNKSLSLNHSSSNISLPCSYRHPQSLVAAGGSQTTTTTVDDLSSSATSNSSTVCPVSTSISTTTTTSKPRDPTLLRSNSLIRIETSHCDSDSNSNSSCSNSSINSNLTKLSVTDNNNQNNNNKMVGKDRLLAVQASEQSYTRSHSDTDFTATSENYNNRKELTVLLPFNHQVGGHTQLMLLDQSTLCKPLVQRELLFYLNIPCELLGFVPNYKGVVEIRHNESSYPTLYHPNKRVTSTSSSSATSSSQTFWRKPELRVQLCTCNDRRLLQKEFSIHQTSNGNGPQQQQQSSGQQQQQSSSSSSLSSSRIEYSSRPSQRYFMLLENIASNFHLPCILDLKMGTRQHGDDASDEKRHRQMAKCAATTSASLGFRICGMQAYHKVSNNYYRLYQADKYHGRRIKNESGLKNELEVYFKNRVFLIGPIIKRLKELRTRVLETLRKTSLRFFSTSLLIVTEGCLASHRSKHTMKHTNSDGEEDDDEFEDDEEDEFEDDFDDDEEEEFEDDDEHHIHFDSEEIDTDIEKHSNVEVVDFDDDNSSSLDSSSSEPPLSMAHQLSSSNGVISSSQPSSSTPPSSSVESRYVAKQLFNCNRDHRHRSTTTATSSSKPYSEVDVRMIDFAHTSFSPNSSSDGFVLGLENLIRLLNEIRHGNSTSQHSNSGSKKRRRSSNMDSHPHAHHHLHDQPKTSVTTTNNNKKLQQAQDSFDRINLES